MTHLLEGALLLAICCVLIADLLLLSWPLPLTRAAWGGYAVAGSTGVAIARVRWVAIGAGATSRGRV